MAKEQSRAWADYSARVFRGVSPLLQSAGITLDDKQVHIGGERFLGNANKVVFTGIRQADELRVVVKASSDGAGKRELGHEHTVRITLKHPAFASHHLHYPEELMFLEEGQYTVSVTRFIAQDVAFVDRPIEQQFQIALRSLQIQEEILQEAVRHDKAARDAIGVMDEFAYERSFDGFRERASKYDPKNKALAAALERGGMFLSCYSRVIARHNGHFVHTDFAPQNFRVNRARTYFLDLAAFRFGNRYESWARFLNAMITMNPELEQRLVAFIRDQRGPEHLLCLRIMRVYKCAFFLAYFSRAAGISTGGLHDLCRARVAFWMRVLHAVCDDKPVPDDVVTAFLSLRAALRSPEESQRRNELQ